MGEVQSVIDTGKASDNNTSAYKYAQKMQQKQSRGADLSDWNIGRQYQKNVRAIQSENEFAAAMSNIKPTEITDSLFNDAGQELNGMASESGVRVSTNGNQDIPTSIKHEWSHMFKMLAPEAYQEYENTIINAAEETNRSAVKNRMDFLKDNYGYSEEVIREEIVAELSGGFNSKAMQRMAEGNQTLAAAIADATRTAKAKLRTAFTDGKYTSSTGLQATFEQLNNAEKQLLRGLENARNNTQINSEIRYSIHNIRGKNNDYGTGVYLDTNIFDGIKPRYWNKVLSKYVYDNLAGQSLTLYDNNGNNEVISFAKKNERVTKDGANNSHKVIDKLSRTKGNANSLGIVHIDELLQTAIDDGINNENSHNWLDKNGWIFKKAYMQDKNGKIYETTLNIAKAADGRNILYALSNTKQIDEGDVPSAHNNERGSHTNRLSVKDSIPNPDGNVKYSLKENGEALPRFIQRKLWEDAVRAAAENKGQASNNENVTRYSVKMDRSGNPYVEIDGDILDGVAPKDRVSTVKNIIKEKFGAPVQTDNGDVAVNRTSRNEYMYSEYTQKLGNTIRVDKFRMANNLDEIIQNQSRVRFESPKHPRKDNFVGFERGEVNVRVGNNDYTAEVIVGVTSVDRKVFYDVINLNPITIEDTISMQDGTTKAPSDSTNTVSSTDIIYENEPIVKNSLKENGQRPRFIPRKNGGKTERPVFVPRKNGGGAVRPVFRMRERTEERPVFIPRMKTDAQLTNDGKNDKISNKVLLPDGTYSKLTDGTEISDIEVFAGKGSNRELRVRYHLMNNYGGQADNWQHTKGRGFVDVNGESRKAMLHWFEEESVGVVERKVKGWSKK